MKYNLPPRYEKTSIKTDDQRPVKPAKVLKTPPLLQPFKTPPLLRELLPPKYDQARRDSKIKPRGVVDPFINPQQLSELERTEKLFNKPNRSRMNIIRGIGVGVVAITFSQFALSSNHDAIPTEQATTTTCPPNTYEVLKDDSLIGILNNHYGLDDQRMRVHEVAELNGINPENLKPGMDLKLPVNKC